MQPLIDFILDNSRHAHWIVLGAILCAGFNLPVSIDLILIFTSVLAATLIPEHAFSLYLSLLIGTYFSAWIAYGMGRFLLKKFLKYRFFSKILHRDRLQKIYEFYDKHGFLTLLFGRFIPFGVRNCIFITAGMSRAPFGTFALRDLVACPLWVTTCFAIFFSIGQNYHLLMQKMKIINIAIFVAFSVTLIGCVWYKKRKKKQAL